MKPIKTRRKTVKDTIDGLKKRGGEKMEAVHEKGGERPDFLFFHPAMSMQSHHLHHSSYFLTSQLAANVCKTASPAANCSLRRHDG